MNAKAFSISNTICPKLSITGQQWTCLTELATGLPDVDWRRNALTHSQESYCSVVTRHGIAKITDLILYFQNELKTNGVCVISCGNQSGSDVELQKRVVAIMMSAVCRPFGAFRATGFWQTLTVNPEAQNLRANSSGHIPFHFDLDQASHPPEYVGLYCVRPDPLGGGTNLIADYRRVFRDVDEATLSELRGLKFSYSTLYDTYNLGEIFNPHPLIDPDFKGSGEWACRYNGKARPQFVTGSKEASIFDRLEDKLNASSKEVNLESGDLIVMDQRRVLHSRRALAKRQNPILPQKDRLLLQLYGNPKNLDKN